MTEQVVRQIDMPLPADIVASGSVTCLGMEFADDEARRAYFTERLREHLQDPAFRAIEGFPIGEDEAILALSDPPYYTACPNPFLPQIIEAWQEQRRLLHESLGLADGTYQREPFATDVSEGKNDPIYNAHSYHTKVPHKAIMRYILHYTEPGDIVFDGFCGSGMTGVAAQLCGDRKAVQELGYTTDEAGAIFDGEQRISRLGARKAVLNDLSPAATFIAYNYNTPVDVTAFEREAKRILDEVEAELGWMYETWHPHCDDPERVKARINYTVWSEVFICPNCGSEIVYYDAAVNPDDFRVEDSFQCHMCGATLNKKQLERMWITYYDDVLQRNHRLVKYVPVLINYQMGNVRYERKPDSADLRLLQRIEEESIIDHFPSLEMLEGERKGKDGYHLKGISHLHHFYFRRPLMLLSHIWDAPSKQESHRVQAFARFFLQGNCLGFTKMNRYSANHYSQVNRYFSGTLFVGSLISEVSPSYSMKHKLTRLSKLSMPGRIAGGAITCQSTTQMNLSMDDSVDYVFVDPPFGNNLHYSELNFFWESWLQVLTQRTPEAVMDKQRYRTLHDYQELMAKSFAELYRVLKPGRWMTVEFHNSQNSVWNAIQEAILRAGFVVADVRTLDKQQETYKQSIQKLVKQDLVISAYKPSGDFAQRFLADAGTERSVWEFIRQHLAQLPIAVRKDTTMETVVERQNYLLFDRMVAYHIQRGVSVPMGAAQFYAGLQRHFVERDGMYFLPEQVAAYDSARLAVDEIDQIAIFVNDEKSAITWLRIQLNVEPLTFQDIQPRFLRELHQARHEDLPDLRVLLEQNFLQDDAGRYYVPDPANAEDLEKLRLRSLLQEFAQYRQGRKRLKVFRTEAVRAGFAQAYADNDFAAIREVAALLPESVVQEDQELLMYLDAASLRL